MTLSRRICKQIRVQAAACAALPSSSEFPCRFYASKGGRKCRLAASKRRRMSVTCSRTSHEADAHGCQRPNWRADASPGMDEPAGLDSNLFETATPDVGLAVRSLAFIKLWPTKERRNHSECRVTPGIYIDQKRFAATAFPSQSTESVHRPERHARGLIEAGPHCSSTMS